MYSVSGQTGELLSSAEILRQIADSERLKRLEAEKAAETAEGDLCEIYREIAELARQHERIFLENPK